MWRRWRWIESMRWAAKKIRWILCPKDRWPDFHLLLRWQSLVREIREGAHPWTLEIPWMVRLQRLPLTWTAHCPMTVAPRGTEARRPVTHHLAMVVRPWMEARHPVIHHLAMVAHPRTEARHQMTHHPAMVVCPPMKVPPMKGGSSGCS